MGSRDFLCFPFYLGKIPIFANNNYTLTLLFPVFSDQIERRHFAMLFENFEAYDVQETHRISKNEGICAGIKKTPDFSGVF